MLTWWWDNKPGNCPLALSLDLPNNPWPGPGDPDALERYRLIGEMHDWLKAEYRWKRGTGLLCPGVVSDETVDDLLTMAERQANWVDAAHAEHVRVMNLPLIVLAGLR